MFQQKDGPKIVPSETQTGKNDDPASELPQATSVIGALFPGEYGEKMNSLLLT